MSQVLAELYQHNLWANLRLIEVCTVLTEEQLDANVPGMYGSVRDTLVHIVFNEENYVALITGQPADPPLVVQQGFPGFEALRQHAHRSGEKLLEIAQTIDPNQILRGEFRGESYAIPVAIPLIQAINHATEHRAQVMVVMTHLGLKPPVLDGWTYGESIRES